MRNVARIKLGYYPLPLEEAKRLRKLLEFSAGTTSVVDPCVGTGAALHQLSNGADSEKYGVELDANRAAAAAAGGITTGLLPFPENNGPVLWPKYTMRQALKASSRSNKIFRTNIPGIA